VALVIGNSGYQHVARLTNPVNDASAFTATLTSAGFDVVESRRDLKIADMRRVLRDFANSSRDADVSVVYYAGQAPASPPRRSAAKPLGFGWFSAAKPLRFHTFGGTFEPQIGAGETR
jgi:uncharacterized caspase-like protein